MPSLRPTTIQVQPFGDNLRLVFDRPVTWIELDTPTIARLAEAFVGHLERTGARVGG